MLRFLVTSKVRRRLLALLWGERASGATQELADRAGVSFASANVELKGMQRARLTTSTWDGRREVHRANWEHPQAKLLAGLVNEETQRPPVPSKEDVRLRAQLKGMGAPLRGVDVLEVKPEHGLETLARGAALARRDPVVARILPLCVWRVRDRLDARAVADQALSPEDKHALGFFLELTGELGKDGRLTGVAEALKDRRMRALRPFFQPAPRRAQHPAPFPLAQKWGFEMEMGIGSFRSMFQKFAST